MIPLRVPASPTSVTSTSFPPPDGAGEGQSGEGDNSGESGEKARESIEELLRKQQESGEPIPEEITRLVKLIPL